MADPSNMSTDARSATRRFRRPHLGLADHLVLVWRAKWSILIAFLLVLGGGFGLLSALPKPAEAASRLLVQSADGGDLGARMATEVALHTRPAVAEIALDRFGLERLYPGRAAAFQAAASDVRETMLAAALSTLQSNLQVTAKGRSRVIEARFRHADPDLARDVLNALNGAYLNYRHEVFEAAIADAPTGETEDYEAQLQALNGEISTFLSNNAISDFATERADAIERARRLDLTLSDYNLRLSELGGEQRALERQLASIPSEIALIVEDVGASGLANLEATRLDLLSRYRPDSQPIEAINRQIEDARAELGRRDNAFQSIRRGPNPVHQQLDIRLAEVKSQVLALRQTRQSVIQQAEAAMDERAMFARLAPDWRALETEKARLEDALAAQVTPTNEASSDRPDREGAPGPVSVLEPARLVRKEMGLDLLDILLVVLAAFLIAMLTGVVRTMGQAAFVTPRSVERTTDMPVLSSVRLKR
ncbi:MAG: hypothetical protein AAFQ84_01190 [Pseudomonadota bacterium]